MGFTDFNDFLHTLRTNEIQRMPAGAKVILSAGCNGRSYFDWISGNYSGIEKHYGIEAYLPMPSDLPSEAVWLPDFLYDIKSVPGNDVDLVFAGQTVEHLWPKELSGFLIEAYRVLKPDGWLVLDSPNRFITQAIQWFHPEHTIEFTVDEIIEMLGLAGFTDVQVKGIWLCFDRETMSYLPLIPDLANINIEDDFRVNEANHRPEDSFVWWIEAKKDQYGTPKFDQLSSMSQSIYDRVFPFTLRREFSLVGEYFQHENTRSIVGANNKPGYLRFGPYIPLRPGKYIAQFHVGFLPEGDAKKPLGDDLAVKLDVTVSAEARMVVEKTITGVELKKSIPRSVLSRKQRLKNLAKKIIGRPVNEPALTDLDVRHLKSFELPFSIDKVEFGVQFRAYSTGAFKIIMESPVQLFECTEGARRNRIS